MTIQLPWTLVDQVRDHNPIVLTLANIVTIDKVADGLSAIGASPIMSTGTFEAQPMATMANAITINLGTINLEQLNQIRAVLQTTPQTTPLILDPVAVGAVKARLTIAHHLLADFPFTVIRGNASEIAALVGQTGHSHGIDAGNENDNQSIAMACAQRYHTLVVLTGPVDVITDGQQIWQNNLSTDLLATNVGSGDMLSSIIGAYLSVSSDHFKAAVVAVKIFTTAGVIAAQEANGLGSWQVKFFDQLSAMTSTKIQEFIKSEESTNGK